LALPNSRTGKNRDFLSGWRFLGCQSAIAIGVSDLIPDPVRTREKMLVIDIRQVVDEVRQLPIAKSFFRLVSIPNKSGRHVRQ
jgi:hypothetical protein